MPSRKTQDPKFFELKQDIDLEKFASSVKGAFPDSEEWEYCAMTSISPLGFGADLNHPETKNLKEKYSSLCSKINAAYSQSNPYDMIQKKLVLLDNVSERALFITEKNL